MPRILVVDDDRALLRAMKLALTAHHHVVSVAVTGEEGLVRVATDSPDIVILDLGLPDIDGIEVCRRIRQWSEVPIIVLSAIGLEDKKVKVLDSGADDYVTKPFGMAELQARIRTALRRRLPNSEIDSSNITFGPLSIDTAHRQATLGGVALELTGKEFELLLFLARNVGKTCTRQMIIASVWGGEYGAESEYLRVYIYRLRQKLGSSTAISIKTAAGIGYSLIETET